MADDVLNLAGRFHSTADGNKALDAIEVFDSTRDDKRQKHFNDDIVRLDEQINNTDGLKDRLEAVEDMASIQVDGGDVQIASTITPSTEGGKIPTVDAVKGYATAKSTFTTGESVDSIGIDDEPTAGSNNLVKSGGVFEKIDGDTLYSNSKTISSGSDRCTFNLGTAFTVDTYCVVKITGTNGNFSVNDSSWREVANANFIDGKEFFLFLPIGSYNCVVTIAETTDHNIPIYISVIGDSISAKAQVLAEESINKPLVNINRERNKSDAYADAGTARNYTPLQYRTNPKGLMIEYLLADGWHTDRCIVDVFTASASGWESLDVPNVSGFALDADVVKSTANQGMTDTKKQNALNNLGIGNVREKTLDLSIGSTIYSLSATIAADGYRAIFQGLTALQADTYATLKVTGLDGAIEFDDNSWASKSSYAFKDGEIQLIKVPANCTNIIVATTDRSPVGASTPITVSIVKNTIESDVKNLECRFVDKDFSILYSINKQIAAGQYQTATSVTPLSTNTKASVKLDGMDGIIAFRNSSNFIVDIYNVKNGVWENIIVPANCTRIDVKSKTAVSSATTFNLRIVSGDITTLSNDDVIAYFGVTNISSGQYRNTSIKINPLTNAVRAKATLRGFNGSISFDNNAWVEVSSYYLTNNVETEITIPSGIQNIIVCIEPRAAVSSDTPFSLKLTYSEVEYRLMGELIKYNENKKYIPILDSMIRTCAGGAGGGQITTYKNLVLASVTDIHNNYSAYRIFDFINRYRRYFNDIIGLGDYVNGSLETPLSINNVDGWGDMIKVIGNHDAYTGWNGSTGTPTGYTTAKESYDAILANDIASWGVQYTVDKCYFYKDYADQKIRVVFVDYMHYDTTQETWLTNVLNDTLNSSNSAYGYHVVICVHSAPTSSLSGGLVKFDNCTFEDYDRNDVSDNISSLPDIVDSFQSQGGIFVCYLCGHKHSCFTGILENYPNQIIIVQPCSAAFDYWRDSAYTWDTDYILQFFLYSFDTYKKFIRVYKVGANFNRNLQHQESMLIQYGDNTKLLYSY